MPVLRIEAKARGGDTWRRAGNVVTQGLAAIGSPFAVLGAIGGSFLGNYFSGKPFPIKFDTDTGKATVAANDTQRFLVNAMYREDRIGEIERLMEKAWDIGKVPKKLPKLYRGEARALIAQREHYQTKPPEGQYMGGGFTVPPGGFAGFSQMTPASRLALGGGRISRVKRRKRKAKQASTGGKSKRKAKAPKKKLKRLVKGSPAAKRFMAALRRKRRG